MILELLLFELLVVHRIDDLEIQNRLLINFTIVVHRIDDLEKQRALSRVAHVLFIA